MHYKAVAIAAMMLGGSYDSSGLLHHDLYDTLERFDRFCNPESPGREGAVAVVILAWEMAHPGEEAMGEEA